MTPLEAKLDDLNFQLKLWDAGRVYRSTWSAGRGTSYTGWAYEYSDVGCLRAERRSSLAHILHKAQKRLRRIQQDQIEGRA